MARLLAAADFGFSSIQFSSADNDVSFPSDGDVAAGSVKAQQAEGFFDGHEQIVAEELVNLAARVNLLPGL